MATEVVKTRIRWGVALVVASGLAIGAVLSERIEERKATRMEERGSVRIEQPEPPVTDNGPEQRCTDFGSECVCSHTLDTTQWQDVSNRVEPLPQHAKACGAIYTDTNNFEGPILAAGVGLTGPTRVFEFSNPNQSDGKADWPDPGATVKRMCARSYVSYATNWGWGVGYAGGTCHNKYMRIRWGSGDSQITVSNNSGGHRIWAYSQGFQNYNVQWFCAQSNPPVCENLGGVENEITLEDCIDPNWCVYELCIDGNNLSQGNATNVYVEGYVETIDQTKRKTWSAYLGDQLNAAPMVQYGVPHWYHQADCWDENGDNQQGTMRHAYGMAVQWTGTSPGLGTYIGQALEGLN